MTDYIFGKQNVCIYDDFVPELRHKETPIRIPSEYQNEQTALLSCTQRPGITAYRQKKDIVQWADFLSREQLPLRTVQFCTKTPQIIFDAVCNQKSIEILRLKFFTGKSAESITGLNMLRVLYIESGRCLESIDPIAELENLEVLILGGTRKITDYSCIGKLKKLKVFGICPYRASYNEILTVNSDSFLHELPNLENVVFTGVKLLNRTFFK